MSESTTRFGTVYKTMSQKESQGEGTAAERKKQGGKRRKQAWAEVLYNCWEEGHVKAKCPKPKDKALLCSIKTGVRHKSAGGVYRKGSVEGRQVERILVVTGCARTMVRKELVPAEEKILMVTRFCTYFAALELGVDGIFVPVEAVS